MVWPEYQILQARFKFVSWSDVYYLKYSILCYKKSPKDLSLHSENSPQVHTRYFRFTSDTVGGVNFHFNAAFQTCLTGSTALCCTCLKVMLVFIFSKGAGGGNRVHIALFFSGPITHLTASPHQQWSKESTWAKLLSITDILRYTSVLIFKNAGLRECHVNWVFWGGLFGLIPSTVSLPDLLYRKILIQPHAYTPPSHFAHGSSWPYSPGFRLNFGGPH